MLAALSRRAYPTYEVFVFGALSGAILALGYLMDSQALLLLGALVAPLLLPWVGLLLGAVTGSVRFFFETLMALMFSALLAFGVSLAAGFAARPLLPRTFEQAFAHSRLWWPDLIILALGAVILTVSFVRSESKPFLPSVILAYEFFLPLAAGGFGLGSGVPNLWPQGFLVFVVHFAWAALFGLVTLLFLRIAPGSAPAFVFASAVGLLLLAVLVVLMSTGNWTAPFNTQLGFPLLAPTRVFDGAGAFPSQTSVAALPPTTAAPPAPTATPAPPTPKPSQVPTDTPTITSTVEPVPIFARVNAPRGGAVLRTSPGGQGIATLDNFTFVELLPETEVYSGSTWVHVVALINGNRLEGWIVEQYLESPAATPATVPGSSAIGTATP